MQQSLNQGGILSVNKPEGISSARVVSIIKRKFGFKRVGHFGTLDPFAKGLLIIGVEQGTKLSQLIMSWPKKYWALVKLGIRTDTLDPTGKVVAKSDPPWPSILEIEAEGKKWIGEIEQRVPQYSAVKVGGMRLYKAARRGIAIESPTKSVHIHSLKVLKSEDDQFEIEVACSKGTYLRSLAVDMAKGLGHEGMLSQLCRLEIGHLDLEKSITIEKLEGMSKEEVFESVAWKSLSNALELMPRVRLSERIANKVLQGQLPLIPPMESEFIRLCTQNDDLVGLLRRGKSGWEIERIFHI